MTTHHPVVERYCTREPVLKCRTCSKICHNSVDLPKEQPIQCSESTSSHVSFTRHRNGLSGTRTLTSPEGFSSLFLSTSELCRGAIRHRFPSHTSALAVTQNHFSEGPASEIWTSSRKGTTSVLIT